MPAEHAAERAPPVTAGPQRGIASRPWWPMAKRVATLVFFALVAWLIVTQARTVEWDEVFSTIRGYTAGSLLLAGALAAASFAIYSSYDLIGRHYTGHALATRQVLTVTFISYAFNLNLGSLVGGFAFRYRLYSRLGLDASVITRILSFSLVTNWLGYLFLGGMAFVLRPLDLPPDWKVGSGGLQVLGAAMLAAAAGYLLLCALSGKRSWTVRGQEIPLPSAKVALLQLGVSSINWMLIAGVVFVLLQQKIAYPAVLSVLLVAAVAGVITHVPAGLGVLEAVFVALLSHEVPRGQLLGALLAYRAVYYLIPLGIATVLFLVVEARAKKAGSGGQ